MLLVIDNTRYNTSEKPESGHAGFFSIHRAAAPLHPFLGIENTHSQFTFQPLVLLVKSSFDSSSYYIELNDMIYTCVMKDNTRG